MFVRFFTVLESFGSADTVRDIRGFAVKSYTHGKYSSFFHSECIETSELDSCRKYEPLDKYLAHICLGLSLNRTSRCPRHGLLTKTSGTCSFYKAKQLIYSCEL